MKPFTTGKIAGLCHVTYRCVLKWIEGGKLNSYRTPGGHNRVRKKDFLHFLKKYNMPVPDELDVAAYKKRVLIVDDDRNMVESVKDILGMQNKYEVDTAYDGFDAGRKFFIFKPDFLILDIRMPGLDGYDVARKVKQSPKGNKIKIIAISGYFKQEKKEKILSMGVDACISKPFKPEKLLQKIEELL